MATFAGLWDDVHGEPHSLLSSSKHIGGDLMPLNVAYARRLYGRAAVRSVIVALLGAAVGGAAAASHTRVASSVTPGTISGGGVVQIETVNDISRVTNSADVTAITNALTLGASPGSYAVDRSGNGGGGRVGRI